MASLSALTDPTLAIIFEASPLGLGHLRVSDALYHGLPKNASPILLGAQAPKSSAIYRFASIHRSTRTVLEMMQLPPLDQPVAAVMRRLLRLQSKEVYHHVRTILNERFTVPTKVLMVATHAIHAHPLGAIKKQMSRELGIQAFLVVQVTDDSPQAIWYVPDADCIFAPSEYTKKKLEEYAAKAHLPKVPIVVTAYPISPLLTQDLAEHEVTERKEQLEPHATEKVHVSIPISGAAVGTAYNAVFMQALRSLSDRYQFHVVVREAEFTQSFLQTMKDLPYVQLSVSTHERATIDNYEKVYKQTTIAIELTKPSEQTFKVLANPKQRGGVIMLFTKPIGGQEYDNVQFLRTHGLVPSEHETEVIWKKAKHADPISDELLAKAHEWRGIILPEEPQAAALVTQWCMQAGIFKKMLQYKLVSELPESQSNGVEQFWTKVVDLIEQRVVTT